MKILKRNSGQFVPISAMVTFSVVMLMIAVVNVYKITRVKLKVQNLADAAALNLATQQAQAFNVITDRNEWMNHMLAGVPSPSDSNAPPSIQDCSAFNAVNKTLIPGIACVENDGPVDDNQQNRERLMSRHIFHSRDGARNYAALIQTINEAQTLFAQAYNSFLGDRSAGSGSNSSTSGPANFEGLLKNDIPDLSDPSIRMVAWNSAANENSAIEQAKQESGQDGGRQIFSKMEGLKFRPHHDIKTRYYIKRCLPIIGCREDADIGKATLGDLFYGQGGGHPAVGWMVPDTGRMPTISVDNGSGSRTPHVGVGVVVTKVVKIPVIGSVPVTAKAKAYMVKGSGFSGEGGGIPNFKPTYWAKLAN